SELYAPVSGHVISVNDSLKDEPELVNEEPYDSGWLLKVKFTNEDELGDLMDQSAYEEYLKNS
ncbi:MAG: glycine cleavage system protein H, partial [bacterium]